MFYGTVSPGETHTGDDVMCCLLQEGYSVDKADTGKSVMLLSGCDI